MIKLTWNPRVAAEGQRIFRDTSPLDTAALPTALATLGAGVGEFLDVSAPAETQLYYAVETYVGSFKTYAFLSILTDADGGGAQTLVNEDPRGFRAIMNATQGFTISDFSTVVFGAEQYDSEAAFDTATGLFTVPAALNGKLMNFGAVIETTADVSFSVYVTVTRAATAVASAESKSASQKIAQAEVGAFEVQTGDTVDVKVFAVNSLTVVGDLKASFWGYEIVGTASGNPVVMAAPKYARADCDSVYSRSSSYFGPYGLPNEVADTEGIHVPANSAVTITASENGEVWRSAINLRTTGASESAQLYARHMRGGSQVRATQNWMNSDQQLSLSGAVIDVVTSDIIDHYHFASSGQTIAASPASNSSFHAIAGHCTDNAGIPDQQPPRRFLASVNATQSLSAGVETKLNFADEGVDTENGYDTATGLFTVPASLNGKFMNVGGSVRLSANETFELAVLHKRAGTIINKGGNSTTGGNACAAMLGLVEVQTGDTFEMSYNGTGASVSNSSACTFWGHEVTGVKEYQGPPPAVYAFAVSKAAAYVIIEPTTAATVSKAALYVVIDEI